MLEILISCAAFSVSFKTIGDISAAITPFAPHIEVVSDTKPTPQPTSRTDLQRIKFLSEYSLKDNASAAGHSLAP